MCAFFRGFLARLGLLLGCWLGLAGVLLATPVIAVDPQAERWPVAPAMDVLIDSGKQLTILDVAGPRGQAAFRPVAKRHPNYSFSPAVFWFRFQVDGRASPHPYLLLLQHNPLNDHITFYRPDPFTGHYVASHTGDQHAFVERELPVRELAFRLPLDHRQPATYYLRVEGHGTINMDLELATPEAFASHTQTWHLIMGLYYGSLITVFLYNLFLFVAIRDRAYVYYLIYVGGLGLTFFDTNGLAFRYLWPSAPAMNTGFMVFTFLGLFGMAQFARHFLKLAEQSRLLNRLSWLYATVALFFAVGVLWLPETLLFRSSQAMAMIMAGLGFAAGVVSMRNGYRPARFYVLAWSVLIVAMVVHPLQNFGLIPTTTFSNYIIQIGSGIEMVLLSLALADRINDMKREKAQIEQDSKRRLSEANAVLETRVQQRTGELADSLRQLRAQHDALLAAARTAQLDADKLEFLRYLSHEMNTPLNWIGGTQIIDRDQLSQDDAELLDFAEQGFVRLQALTATVLRYFEVAGMAPAQRRDRVDVPLLVEQVLAGAGRRDDGKVVMTRVESPVSLTINSHAPLLRELLSHLIGNAFDHAGETGREPEVGVEVEVAGNEIRLAVTDNGRGLAEEARERILEPFANMGSAHSEQGFGLSLATARALAQGAAASPPSVAPMPRAPGWC